jgi:hypothetical protein
MAEYERDATVRGYLWVSNRSPSGWRIRKIWKGFGWFSMESGGVKVYSSSLIDEAFLYSLTDLLSSAPRIYLAG